MEAEEVNQFKNKTLDELIGELNEQKENLITPDSEKVQSEPEDVYHPEDDPLAQERAERTGERLARITDTILSNTFSIVASSDEVQKYKADDRDLKDIGEAYAQLNLAKQIDLPPALTLTILLIMVYMPKLKIALTDRRYNRLKSQMDNMQHQIDELNKERLKIEIENEKLKTNENS